MGQSNAIQMAKNQRKIIAKLKTIPSGVVSLTHVGYASTGDKAIIEQRGNRAAGLDITTTIDILSLDFGFYAGRKFANAPVDVGDDTSLVTVRVSGYPEYKYIEYTQIATGFVWYRSMYTNTYDTGWVSTKPLAITPINGCTGEMVVRKLPGYSFTNIELRMNLTCSISSTGVYQIGTLPSGYTTVDENQVQGLVVANYGTPSGPLGISINNGNKINVFRVDNGTSNGTITAIHGNIQFSRFNTKGL